MGWCSRSVSRNTKDGLEAIDILRKYHTKFFIAGIDNDIFNDTTYLLITMQFAIGELERATIRNRLTAGKIKSYDAGNRKINSVLGYDGFYDNKGKRSIVINEQEAELVKIIYKLFVEDKSSYSQIARYVNGSGFKAKRAGKMLNYKGTMRMMETHWLASHVKAIILRPEYTGLVWNYEKTQLLESTYFSSIIDRNIWMKAQDRAKQIAAPMKNGYRITEHPVSGIMRCAKCNAPYFYTQYKRKTKSLYYYRHKVENQKHAECNNRPKCINADFIESIFAVLYINTFSDVSELKKLKELYADIISKDEDQLQNDKTRIGERILEAEKKIRNLVALAEATGDIDDVAQRIKAVKEEKKDFEKKLETVIELYDEKVSKYTTIFDQFTENNLKKYFASAEYERRIIYIKAIRSAVIQNEILEIEFITGRKVNVELKEKQPWITAQIANYKAGVYTFDWINNQRNGAEVILNNIEWD